MTIIEDPTRYTFSQIERNIVVWNKSTRILTIAFEAQFNVVSAASGYNCLRVPNLGFLYPYDDVTKKWTYPFVVFCGLYLDMRPARFNNTWGDPIIWLVNTPTGIIRFNQSFYIPEAR